MRSLAFGQLLELGPLLDAFTGRNATVEQLSQIADWVSENFESWNLQEEDGTPVAATREALLGEEFELFTAIVIGWTKKLTGQVAPPLPSGSANGRPPAEPARPDPAMENSLPMTETESPQS
jgi:hypothetical protein